MLEHGESISVTVKVLGVVHGEWASRAESIEFTRK